MNLPEGLPKTPEQNRPYLLTKQVSAPSHEQIIGFLFMILLSGYFSGCLTRIWCCDIAIPLHKTQHFPPREVGYVALGLIRERFCNLGFGNSRLKYSHEHVRLYPYQ